MRLLSAGGVVAMAAYRGHHFQGYAVRTDAGWVCVAALGMSCTKQTCRTLEDCRTMLRSMSHAGRFDDFRDIDAFTAVIRNLPPHQQLAISPESISGVPVKLPKLNV